MAAPMYRQIAEDLLRQIESGALAPGARLPAEVDLRDRFGASRNTVRDAIKVLMTRGLVETRAGQGTFVVQKIEPFVVRLGFPPGGGAGESPSSSPVEATPPQVEVRRADGLIGEELGLQAGAQVISRHQLRRIDSVPWSLQTSFYSMDLVLRGAARLLDAEDIAAGTDRYLAETLDIRAAGATDRLSVRPPDGSEVAFFGLPADGHVNVIQTVRTVYDQTGTPVRVTVTVFAADRNQLLISFGEAPGLGGPAGKPDDRPPAAVALER